MRQAVFLDRDGVINRKAREGEYITRWGDFEFLPGVDQAIAELNAAGFAVVVVTNQRCVAKELVSIAELEKLHGLMTGWLAERGARIDAVYYCPHELGSGCRCRKPAPGMFVDAASDLAIDLRRSWMIGDSDIDMEAGKNAGSRTALVADILSPAASGADFVASSLVAVVEKILDFEKRESEAQASRPAGLPLPSLGGW